MPSKRIFVIDDDRDVAEALAEVLTVGGYDTRFFTNPVRVVSALDDSVALLIIDHTMPWVSGPDVIRQVRKKHPALPVILMSGYASVADAAKDLGVAFALKPIEPERLLAVAKTVLA
jgi:DNA-binding NtrC family response regulator